MKNLLFLVLIVITISGCDKLFGEEVARVKIDQLSNNELFIKETILNLKKDEEISLWADMDMDYETNLSLVYSIEIWKDGKLLGNFDLDAMDVNPRMMEVKTSFNDKTSWSYSGKMKSFKAEDTGTYLFKAILRSSENPTLILNKAELVFKK
jgi:hypothetical protein